MASQPPFAGQPGYPPPQQGYPPPQGAYPPQQGYPPPQGAYPPQQGYPPPQGAYPPQQGGYPVYTQPMMAPGAQPPMMAPGQQPPMMMPQGVQPMMAPMMMPNIGPPGEILMGHQRVFIIQGVNMIEAITGGIWEQKNTYVIKGTDGRELMFAKEFSSMGCRQFCAPEHPLGVRFYPFVGQENTSGGADMFPRDAPVMTALKQGCCVKCDGCFACSPQCVDEMQLYEGLAVLDRDTERKCFPCGCNEFQCCCGEPTPCYHSFPKDRPPIASILEPLGGGGCAPGLSILPRAIDAARDFIWGPPEDATAYIQGPAVFGGCSEYCCEAKFGVESSKFPNAAIYKKTPSDLSDFARTMFTDSDVYEVVFDPNMNAQDRASLLAAAFMIDYKFFEDFIPGCCPCPKGLTVESTAKGIKIHIELFKCSVYGCICPCKVTIPLEQDGDH